MEHKEVSCRGEQYRKLVSDIGREEDVQEGPS